MIRYGHVSAQDPDLCRVRVTFDQCQGMTSWWLAVVQPKTFRDQAYHLPDIGEHVVCLLDPVGETGVVLGAIYSTSTRPPVAGVHLHHLLLEDGTRIEYDRQAHRLSIEVPHEGTALEVSTAGRVTVSAERGVTIDVPAGQRVYVGGEEGKQLATIEHVRETFLTHIHPIAGPKTGPPIPTGTELEWPQVTREAYAE